MTPTLTIPDLVRVAGVLHLGILTATPLIPTELQWNRHLAPVPPLLRHLIWTHGAYVVLTILAFALISLTCAADYAHPSNLARAFATFVATFWGLRLLIQLFLFDPRPHIAHRPLLTLGYHGLTIVFTTLTTIYTLAALR